MRRLLRRVFNFAAVVSAVPFVGVCVLWVRSYFRQGRLYAERGARYAVGADRGTFWVEEERGYTSRFDARTWTDTFAPYADHWQFGAGAGDEEWQVDCRSLCGNGRFGHEKVPSPWSTGWASGGADIHYVAVPAWVAAASAALGPAIYLVIWPRTRQRRAAGLCLACGYDLRATPGRCPECGSVPDVKGIGAWGD